MKGIHVLTVLLLLLVGSACSMFTESVSRGSVVVEATGSELHLTNHTGLPVYYLAFERSFLALANWAPCTTPQGCPAIQPGEQVSVSYESIGGYEPGKEEAVVYWYHLRPKAEGGFEPDSIRAIVVEL